MSAAITTTYCEQPAGVLIASSNAFVRKQLMDALLSNRWPVEEAMGGADALGKLETSECRVLLLDQKLSDLDAIEVNALIQVRYPGVDVLMLDSETGMLVMPRDPKTSSAQHLFSTLQKNVGAVTRVPRIQSAPARLSVGARPYELDPDPLPGMIGSSDAMRRMYRLARLAAPRDIGVLITGESGTGKELVAQAIHKLSPRAGRPFVVINCAAIPDALLESELFGYVRGAFTGAVQSRVGRIHAAQGGTLFLDEIGELPLNLQSKILRFLEQGEVQRLGSADVFKVDVRVIAATNVQLEKKIVEQQFRKDLFYRLSVFPIEVPPMNQRMPDLVPLTEHFLSRLTGQKCCLSADATALLQQHTWPGNVRELRHVIERASILAEGSPIIVPEHIVLSSPELNVILT